MKVAGDATAIAHGGADSKEAAISEPETTAASVCRRGHDSSSATARRRERGSALIAVLILGFAVVGGAAVLGRATYELAAELRVRREALCARYAALAGLALGTSVFDQASTVGGDVAALSVTSVRRSATWCVTRSSARCGDARRVMERTAALTACGS